jgi:hypothetical protein
MRREEVTCPKHPLTVMVCPRCIAGNGGRKTARTHTHEQLSVWGAMGGRPRKKKKAAGKKKMLGADVGSSALS